MNVFQFNTYKQTGDIEDVPQVSGDVIRNLQPIKGPYFDNKEKVIDNKVSSITEKKQEEVLTMSNDSFNTLFQELKADMREREERSRREISEREERFKDQLTSYAQEASEREGRFENRLKDYSDDSKEREQRFLDTIQRLETSFTNHENTIRTMKNHNLAVNIALFVGMLAIVITLIVAVK